MTIWLGLKDCIRTVPLYKNIVLSKLFFQNNLAREKNPKDRKKEANELQKLSNSDGQRAPDHSAIC